MTWCVDGKHQIVEVRLCRARVRAGGGSDNSRRPGRVTADEEAFRFVLPREEFLDLFSTT